MTARAAGRRRRLATALTVALVASVTATTSASAQDPDDPPVQYPFACTVQDEGLGQPIVDNQDGEGVPVYAEDDAGQPTDEIVGYSRDCDAPTRHLYYAVDTTGALHVVRDHGEGGPSSIADALPTGVEVAMIEPDDVAVDGPVPYLVRHERGVINRFIYSTSMLATEAEVLTGDPLEPDHTLWNDRLLFQFQGGVGIGHSQGRYDGGGTRARAIKGEPDRLARGEAVIYSTGTRTGDHYNLLVGGRTAQLVKDHFVATHGEPSATVALGGSGGGIQQYVYNQNHPDLLDGAVPQMSYPDMTTQTIHVGDCSLLDRWMDLDAESGRWDDWDERRVIQGLNSIEGYLGSTAQQLAQIQAALGQTPQTGSSECLEGWFGLAALAMNPTFGSESNWDLLGDQVDDIERTHWSDAVEAYGTDPETGFARVPWDNVGVQYGLRALADGELSPEEFLDLNARVGSWKDTPDMVEEGFPFVGSVQDLMSGAVTYDPWSMRNMHLSPDGGVTPAPRRSGDEIAIANAYASGLVTMGAPERLIPTIDVREHMEHVLDMHNVHQSFAARQRLLDNQGHAVNQAIWFLGTDASGNSPAAADVYHAAVDTVHAWIVALEGADGDVAAARPDGASDRCFEVDGTLIASGDGVWDGTLGDEAEGDCTQAFDIFTTSRIEAGGPITGDVYKCRTMPVATAVAEGLYGVWDPSAAEVTRLEAIHPEGVCDYDLRGVADPRADVADAVSAAASFGTLRVSGADPGAVVQVRQGGEVVATATANTAGRASVRGLADGTYVVAQERDGARGLLSAPVAFAASGFVDVPADHPHREGILALAGDGIMLGWPDGTFRPQRSVTRAQLASTLQRVLDLPAGPSGVFRDVHPDSVHTDAIEALAAAGVIRGFADGRFGPDEPVRRDQLSSLLARAAGMPDGTSHGFRDVAGSPHEGAIAALAGRGVVQGWGDGTFRPRLAVSRGQVATMVHGARAHLED